MDDQQTKDMNKPLLLNETNTNDNSRSLDKYEAENTRKITIMTEMWEILKLAIPVCIGLFPCIL